MRSRGLHIYMSLASVIGLALCASPVMAQDAPEPTNIADGDIVVTATKRNESLVKVPATVSVFSNEAIAAAGITRPADFLNSVPNVTFIEDNAGEAFINIRGQTSARNSDPNVAIVIDGVTLSTIKGFNSDLFDLQQIEVLKGPQSALYGRNAAAGAIVVTTKQPGDEFEGHVGLTVGNFDTQRLTGGVSGPLSQTLKLGVAGSYSHTAGSFTNITNGQKVAALESYSGRARLIFEPTDRLTMNFQVGGHRSRGASTAYIAQIVGLPNGGFPGTELDANNTDIPYDTNVVSYFSEDFYDTQLKIDYDLDFATITSISAYNRLRQVYGSDSPPYRPTTGTGDTVQRYSYLDKNYSQELRLTSRSDQRFRYQVGFYILRFLRDQTSKINLDTLGVAPRGDQVDLPGTPQPTLAYSNPKGKTTSYAPFASFQFDITPELHLSAAGRYDTEHRSIREAAPVDINPLTGASYNNCVALTGAPIDQCKASRTFKQFEPKVSLSYDIGSNATAYVSYGKGFKSGGFNPIGGREALIAAAEAAGLPASSVYVQDQFGKEVSESYEVGIKTRLFDRRLSLNFAAFSTTIENAQQFEFFPSAGLQTIVGIDRIKTKGIDVDFDARLPGTLRLFGGFGYTRGRVDKFSGNPSFEGNVAPGAFKYTINLGATASVKLTNDLDLVPRVEFNRFGSIWWDAANTPGTKRDPLNLVDARLTLKSAAGWDISAYSNNLFNEKYYQIVVPLLGFFTVNSYGPTRSYGIEARLSF